MGVYQTHSPSYHKWAKHFYVSNILPQPYLLVCTTWSPEVSKYSYLYAMANIIQHRVVYRFSNIPYRTLHVRWRYNFVSSRCVLIGRQNAYLSASDLFFMDVHSLDWKQESMGFFRHLLFFFSELSTCLGYAIRQRFWTELMLLEGCQVIDEMSLIYTSIVWKLHFNEIANINNKITIIHYCFDALKTLCRYSMCRLTLDILMSDNSNKLLPLPSWETRTDKLSSLPRAPEEDWAWEVCEVISFSRAISAY